MSPRKTIRQPAQGLLATLGLIAACATGSTPARSTMETPYTDRTVEVKPSVLGLDAIHRVLAERSDRVRTPRPGVWHLSVDGVPVLIFVEDSRVRIMAPIFSLEKLGSAPEVERALLYRLLRANFDRSVDARYALLGHTVFASVTHPRGTLGTAELDRYLEQVVNLHKNTFRTGERGYSSLPPTPDSVEIDPREDATLYERPLEPAMPTAIPTHVL